MIEIIRRPTLDDLQILSDNARKADKEEVFFISGETIYENLINTSGIYENSFVWEIDNQLICIYGITPCDNGEGIIWLLATDKFDNYTNIFRRKCKTIYKELIVGYNYLYNYVHFRHKKAIKWLKWLGCEVFEPEPIGLNGELFCKFEVKNV